MQIAFFLLHESHDFCNYGDEKHFFQENHEAILERPHGSRSRWGTGGMQTHQMVSQKLNQSCRSKTSQFLCADAISVFARGETSRTTLFIRLPSFTFQ